MREDRIIAKYKDMNCTKKDLELVEKLTGNKFKEFMWDFFGYLYYVIERAIEMNIYLNIIGWNSFFELSEDRISLWMQSDLRQPKVLEIELMNIEELCIL